MRQPASCLWQAQRVAASVAQVQGLLAAQQALLAAADGDVVRIAHEQQEEAERRSQVAFQAALIAARQAAARAVVARTAVAAPGDSAPSAVAGAEPPAYELPTPGLPSSELSAAGRPGSGLPASRPPGFELPSAGGSGAELPRSQRAVAVLAAARAQLGKPYVWGATGPDSFDCSGLTRWAFAAAGVRLPRTAAEQWSTGSHPALADLQPGDLLFWASAAHDPGTIHHVAIYLGQGQMIAAPHTGTVVKVQQVYANGYFGATSVG